MENADNKQENLVLGDGNCTVEIDLKFLVTNVITRRNRRLRKNNSLLQDDNVMTGYRKRLWTNCNSSEESDFDDDPDDHEVDENLRLLSNELQNIECNEGFDAMIDLLERWCKEAKFTRGIPLKKTWGVFNRDYLNFNVIRTRIDNFKIE